MIEIEKWRPIPGCERLQVSSLGKVIGVRGRVLSPELHSNGYFRFSYYIGKRERRMLVHRAVALAFLPNPGNKPFVAHNDGVCTNNEVSNLRWATQKENLNDRKQHGTDLSGTRNGCAKLSEADVRFILLHSEMSGPELGSRFNITKENVGRIRRRETWKHIDVDGAFLTPRVLLRNTAARA